MPENRELAIATPVYEKGDKKCALNERPVSDEKYGLGYLPICLTSVLGKIIETVIRDKFKYFLKEKKILVNGFFNQVNNNWEEEIACDVISFSLSTSKRILIKFHLRGYYLESKLMELVSSFVNE